MNMIWIKDQHSKSQGYSFNINGTKHTYTMKQFIDDG